MADFTKFQKPIEDQIAAMGEGELFVVDVAGDELWQLYLDSFPEGTNEIFRVRAEHDCSADKNFIRNMGNVVSIKDGEIQTIWDVSTVAPYDTVTSKLAARVRSAEITGVFRTKEHAYGSKKSRATIEGTLYSFDHFYVKLPRKYVVADAPTVASRLNSAAQVFERGLEELTAGAVDTVLDLISDKALYRGDEHLPALNSFRKMQEEYRKINDPTRRTAFVWENVGTPAARFRNTVIGTLIQDLSEGMDLEKAVKRFESKGAPQNYKRPKALITQKMVADAAEKLRELGLEDAVNRRYARISDVSVNDVLFVDNTVKPLMKDGIEGLLATSVKPKKVDITKATPIGIDEFMASVVPNAPTVDLFLERGHMGNFMSVTAPQESDTGGLFQWNNDFAWSYDGDVTDGVKERVKRAGGNVTAKMRVSLGWYNYDDLDIHVHEPGGNHISYNNKSGKLDVDMNAGGSRSREPVENVCWNGRIPDGTYRVDVHNYSKRENVDHGFELEVEFEGQIWSFAYDKPVTGTVKSLNLVVKNGKLVDIPSFSGVTSDSKQVEKWGVHTNTLARVDTMMLSPNHWGDDSAGNKHWFFILKGCKNPDETRGIYNEFLNPALTPHRKVFEVLGSKTKCTPTDDQLSGVGFTATRKDTATVVANGRAYEITF